MNNTLTPINDISSVTFDELFARYQSLDTECLLIYLFDKVEESALVHLAEQFHITGTEGWTYCQTTEEKRNVSQERAQQFKEGLRDGVPIALGYLAVAFTLGIQAKAVSERYRRLLKKCREIVEEHGLKEDEE